MKPGDIVTFDTRGLDSVLRVNDGKRATVIRALTGDEADIFDVGPMWWIKFDGDIGTISAFEDELTVIA